MNPNKCQKCGRVMMRLSDFGRNVDDTINTEYCRHCCRKGVVDLNGARRKKSLIDLPA